MKNIKISNPEVLAFSKDTIEAISKYSPVNGVFSVRSLSLKNASDKIIGFNVNFPRIGDRFTVGKSMHVYWYACELRKLEAEYGEAAEAVSKNPTPENKEAHKIIGARLDSVKPALQEVTKVEYLRWVEPFVNADRREPMSAYSESLRMEFDKAKKALAEEFASSDNTCWKEFKDKFTPFLSCLWNDNKPSEDIIEAYTFNANVRYAKEVFAMYGGKFEKSREGMYTFMRSKDEELLSNFIKGAVIILHEKAKQEGQDSRNEVQKVQDSQEVNKVQKGKKAKNK